MTTVYVSIGNSDDKLTQARWAQFFSQTNLTVREVATAVYGQWVSEPASAWQNACWAVEIHPETEAALKNRLKQLATNFDQDSIAWAVAQTEFLESEMAHG